MSALATGVSPDSDLANSAKIDCQLKTSHCTSLNVSNMLRDAGMRLTRQRIALGRLLYASGDRHLTAEMLHEEANPRPHPAVVGDSLQHAAPTRRSRPAPRTRHRGSEDVVRHQHERASPLRHGGREHDRRHPDQWRFHRIDRCRAGRHGERARRGRRPPAAQEAGVSRCAHGSYSPPSNAVRIGMIVCSCNVLSDSQIRTTINGSGQSAYTEPSLSLSRLHAPLRRLCPDHPSHTPRRRRARRVPFTT